MEEGGVRGGTAKRPSTNRRAAGGVTATQPIRARDRRKGLRMTSPRPRGQSRGLPPVLASERDEERLCAPKPASERGRVARRRHPSSEAGGIIIGAVCAFVRVGSGSGGLVRVVLLSFSAGSPVVLVTHEIWKVSAHGGSSPASLRPADFARLGRPDHAGGPVRPRGPGP